ncbi:MAG: ACT domain-containing protein [Candidatus Fimadaptatus sp.]
MFVKQVSIFLENTKGSLKKVTALLRDNGIDLIALSIADTRDFGILRTIVSDTDRAVEIIREAGYAVKLTDVLAVAVPDRPGGLNDVLELLDEAGIAIEYLYSFVRTSGDHALIIFRVEELERASGVLEGAGIKLLMQEQVRNL